ncbi:hypothetical protein, partial [Brucella melitensis]|uniref:hypothetical protein n=1 Tax=Brucella melitensis TaxID=29459 RepID=UPI0032B7AC8E
EISRNGIDCGEIWCCPKSAITFAGKSVRRTDFKSRQSGYNGCVLAETVLDNPLPCADICLEIGRPRHKLNDGNRLPLETGRRAGKCEEFL